MSEFESGKCLHCGLVKGSHRSHNYYGKHGAFCSFRGYEQFEDSGLKRVRDNSEKVLKAAQKVCDLPKSAYVGDPTSVMVAVPIEDFETLRAAIADSLTPPPHS